MDQRYIGLSQISGVVVALFFWVAPVHGVVVTVNPGVDGYIRGSSTVSSGNFSNGTMQLGSTTTEGINDLLSFDLSGVIIPDGMQITSVTLSFTPASVDATSLNAAVEFQLYQSLRSFSTGASWNNYTSSAAWEAKGGVGSLDRGPILLSSIMINPTTVTTGEALTLGSTSALISLVDGLAGTADPLRLWFGLASQIDGDRHLLQIASMENATASYRPVLSITYDVVPEPSTIALGVMSGGILLISLRRRKTRD